MRRFPLWLRLVFVGLMMLSSVLLTACDLGAFSPSETHFDAQPTAAHPAGKPSVPLEMELSFTALPRFEQGAPLVLRVKSLIDPPGTAVQIASSHGLESADASLVWQGTISANEPRETRVGARPTNPGFRTITAGPKSQLQLPRGANFGRKMSLPVNVGDKEPTRGNPTREHDTPTTQSTVENLDRPAMPIEMDLSFSALPLVDQALALAFWVRPLIDAPNTTARITLPEGLEPVGGVLDWQGDVAADKAVDIQVEVKASKTGFSNIIAESVTRLSGSALFGRSLRAYVDVSETGVTVSRDGKHLCDRHGGRRGEGSCVGI